MKKGVLALILVAVLIIIVSPGIVGKLAENSVGENLNWAARESGELVVTSEGFDRGWFSSEGQHRVELGDGNLRTLLTSGAGDYAAKELPVLLINTHLDHGIIPMTSMKREQGSLAPGLGSAVSTMQVELAPGETFDIPGTFYSKVSIGGDLNTRYLLEAGSRDVDDGTVSWDAATIDIAADAGAGDVKFDGKVGAMTFGNAQQTVKIDGMTFDGDQQGTQYGFSVGTANFSMGPMTIEAFGNPAGGLKGVNVKAMSSVDDGQAAGTLQMVLDGQEIPGFGVVSLHTDMKFAGLDATALGAINQRVDSMVGAVDPEQIMMEAEEEFKALLAAGLNIEVQQFDVALPMGTVEAKMSFDIPASDRADFVWTSLILATVAAIDIKVPEALVQMATSMSPEAGAVIAMGYLKKNGDFYEMDADYKKGLLTINGAPMPIPLGAFQ